MSPVDVEEVQERADRIIASAGNETEFEYDRGWLCDGYFHGEKCEKSVDSSQPCIVDSVKAARQQKRKLGMLHLLKDCAQNPLAANGLRTLDGMAQGSCIYELAYVQMVPLSGYDSNFILVDVIDLFYRDAINHITKLTR